MNLFIFTYALPGELLINKGDTNYNKKWRIIIVETQDGASTLDGNRKKVPRLTGCTVRYGKSDVDKILLASKPSKFYFWL